MSGVRVSVIVMIYNMCHNIYTMIGFIAAANLAGKIWVMKGSLNFFSLSGPGRLKTPYRLVKGLSSQQHYHWTI